MATTLPLFDAVADRDPAVQAAIDALAVATEGARGAVYTRPAVANFMLDLLGYTVGHDLTAARLLEPACGAGDFLLLAVERLLQSAQAHGALTDHALARLGPAVRAVEVHDATLEMLRGRLHTLLRTHGIVRAEADTLLDQWLVGDDFLLAPLNQPFTHIVGNPPYVRQERIAPALLATYRQRYATLFDRADLYVPFLERCLELLAPGGELCLICPDRWMQNRYGGPLRALVARHFALRFCVEMTDVDAFHAPVDAYPAIIGIAAQPLPETRLASRPALDPTTLAMLASALRGDAPPNAHVTVVPQAAQRRGAWGVHASLPTLALLRRLEHDFPSLEATGCRVGIGVATGCDAVFIARADELPVEPERQLPLVMAPDVRSGAIAWAGHYVLNPFEDDGTLADLARYPRLAAYLAQHEAQLRARHVARKQPRAWYRTIDRIDATLTAQPKLLIPDIAGQPRVAYDPGGFYPHHNLYVVTSAEWALPALQAVLRSSLTHLWIANYATTLRGGFLRFQAQYLRRLRLPHWNDVSATVRAQLRAAATEDDAACDEAVATLYGLSTVERATIAEHASQRGRLCGRGAQAAPQIC
ncbi:MAG: Eco57I restriction-modification methylase domain-containing protein [Chloroflexales bacterium]|nr:Eco57I restriction-modification methylase domain-containing protein [Chloroflexales bacterium]